MSRFVGLALVLVAALFACGDPQMQEAGQGAGSTSSSTPSVTATSALSPLGSIPSASSPYDTLRDRALAEPQLSTVLPLLRSEMGDLSLARQPVPGGKRGGQVLSDWLAVRRVAWAELITSEKLDVAEALRDIEPYRGRRACLRGEGAFTPGLAGAQLVAESGGRRYVHSIDVIGKTPATSRFEMIPNVSFCGFIIGRYLPRGAQGEVLHGLYLVGSLEP